MITIGTRGSALALKQTEIVKDSLLELEPNLDVQVKIIKTEGDKNLSPIPLDVVGKGWFTKDIEKALLEGQIDLAVHSLKDLPEELPDGLTITAVTKREDARDVLVSKYNLTLEKLPKGAIIGTDSARRRLQLLRMRADLRVESIRGNVNTRLKKLQTENYDGLLLAAAGLKRLSLQGVITQYFDPTIIIPAPGQGALAVETRLNDHKINDLLKGINDVLTQIATHAERAFAAAIGGGCKLPVGAYAVCKGDICTLHGMIASLDGSRYIQDVVEGSCDEVLNLGRLLAVRILDRFNGTQ